MASLSGGEIARMAGTAFPGCRVVEAHLLSDGYRNANFRLLLDMVPEPVVLRVYRHDPALCRKELDLLRLVAGKVPVPDLIHAGHGRHDVPPFLLMRFVEGISFRELRRQGDAVSIAQAARSVGETLAAIHRFTFPQPGWLHAGPTAGPPLLAGPNAMPRFVDRCLASANLRQRLPPAACEAVHALIWSASPELSACERQANLVHSDFNKRNVLVTRVEGVWKVAAILDWELAVASTPLTDFGNFLRYERPSHPQAEPHFSQGYLAAGGSLPPEWRRLSRIVDLVALCAGMAEDSLPPQVAAELSELVHSTICLV